MKRMSSHILRGTSTKKVDVLLKMIVDGKNIQIMQEGTNIWTDFDGEKHGKLIFSDSDYRYRVKPVELKTPLYKFYYNEIISNGSRTDIFDSDDKDELVAASMNDD